MNRLLGVSQAKSVAQWAFGDTEGALNTQDEFTSTFPIISQTHSVVEWTQGDTDKAWETQKKFFSGLSDSINGIPGVGHIKGVVHYVWGDRDGGDRAMKSASRTTGVMVGGTAGFMMGGPAGAVAGGVLGGVITDGITTGVDSAVHGEYRPTGIVD